VPKTPTPIPAAPTPPATPAPLDLRDWRKKRVGTFVTSDGLALTYRKIHLADLAAQGVVPMPLFAKLEKLQTGDTSAVLNEIDDLVVAINAVVCATVKQPHVLSVEAANALIDQVHATFAGTAVRREEVAAWLDAAAAGEEAPELDDPARAELVARYIGAVLVTDIAFEDRMALFTLLTEEAQQLATFPGAA